MLQISVCNRTGQVLKAYTESYSDDIITCKNLLCEAEKSAGTN